MPAGSQSLFASALFAATGVILLAIGANELWSAMVFVLSVVFLGFYLRASYLVLRHNAAGTGPVQRSGEDPPD